jgi:hypothetical protein
LFRCHFIASVSERIQSKRNSSELSQGHGGYPIVVIEPGSAGPNNRIPQTERAISSRIWILLQTASTPTASPSSTSVSRLFVDLAVDTELWILKCRERSLAV